MRPHSSSSKHYCFCLLKQGFSAAVNPIKCSSFQPGLINQNNFIGSERALQLSSLIANSLNYWLQFSTFSLNALDSQHMLHSATASVLADNNMTRCTD